MSIEKYQRAGKRLLLHSLHFQLTVAFAVIYIGIGLYRLGHGDEEPKPSPAALVPSNAKAGANSGEPDGQPAPPAPSHPLAASQSLDSIHLDRGTQNRPDANRKDPHQ